MVLRLKGFSCDPGAVDRIMAYPVRKTQGLSHSPAADLIVREGFICPICMQDLGTIHELQGHFEHDHAEADKTILQQLKGALLRKVGISDGSSAGPHRTIHNGSPDFDSNDAHNVIWEAQNLGQVQNHTDYFRRIRDSRMERFMVETNKLVIRLDKLAHEAPSDPRQRLGCGKSFKMFMRKHHCRLCGSVICSDCSSFLEPEFVEKMTNPVGAQLRPVVGPKHPHNSQQNGIIKRSNSSESLMSVVAAMASKDKEQLIRVCAICKSLLERRSKQVDEKHARTELEDLHERIIYGITDAEKIYPAYEEMALSLQSGETNFNLHQAAELKAQLTKFFDTIDAVSKKMALLPPPAHAKEEKLRNNIRINAVEYLKSRVLTMPPLPSAEQLEELQRKRREEIKRRLAAQKAAEESRRSEARRSSRDFVRDVIRAKPHSEPKNPFASESNNPFDSENDSDDAYNPFNEPDHDASSDTRSPRRSNGGWAAEPVKAEDIDKDDDPLLQQIAVVKKTIEQAKKAGRHDEVASLTEHLNELNKFYREKLCTICDSDFFT